MKLRSATLVGCLAAAPFDASALQDPGSVPPAVIARLTQDAADCRDIGGRLGVRSDVALVTPADFNGDALPDYLLNQHALECDASASMFCGSAGCGHVVFLSQRDGRYVQAADIAASGLEIASQGGRDVLHFGGDGPERLTWGWDGREFTRLRPGVQGAVVSVEARGGADARALLDMAYGQWSGDGWRDAGAEFYSPGLRALIDQTWIEDEAESGAFYDPLCPCNDWGMLRYTVNFTHLDLDTAIAEVPIAFARDSEWAGSPAQTHVVHIVMTPQGWRIDDIFTEEHGSTREVLTRELASRGR